MDQSFWFLVLDELKVSKLIQEIWMNFPEKFMRTEVLLHHDDYGLDFNFA
jgi:hypothetical protein